MALQLPNVTPLKLILGVFTVVLGVAALSSFSQTSQLKRQLGQKSRETQSLKASNEELQQRIANFENERKGLEARINDLRNQLSSEGGELGQLRGSVVDLQRRAEALEREKTDLEAEITRLTTERDFAREQVQKLDQDKKSVERSAAKMRERFALLDRDYQQLVRRIAEIQRERATQVSQVSVSTWADPASGASAPAGDPTGVVSPESAAMTSAVAKPAGSAAWGESSGGASSGPIELPPIIVGKDQANIALPVRGRLVDVNAPNRFIVLDKGANDGVHVGMTFDIMRGGSTIAQGVVIRVRSRLAACDLITSRSPGFPQIGDSAIQHSP